MVVDTPPSNYKFDGSSGELLQGDEISLGGLNQISAATGGLGSRDIFMENQSSSLSNLDYESKKLNKIEQQKKLQ